MILEILNLNFILRLYDIIKLDLIIWLIRAVGVGKHMAACWLIIFIHLFCGLHCKLFLSIFHEIFLIFFILFLE